MIVVLLSYSTSLSQNDTISLTGVVEQDSVLVPIEALRIANAKMIELKYEKEINNNLTEVIRLDSILIKDLKSNIAVCEYSANKEIKRIKRQRNKAIVGGAVTSGCLVGLMILFYGK